MRSARAANKTSRVSLLAKERGLASAAIVDLDGDESSELIFLTKTEELHLLRCNPDGFIVLFVELLALFLSFYLFFLFF